MRFRSYLSVNVYFSLEIKRLLDLLVLFKLGLGLKLVIIVFYFLLVELVYVYFDAAVAGFVHGIEYRFALFDSYFWRMH